MTDVVPCSTSECEGNAQILYDGSSYCPMCSTHFPEKHNMTDKHINTYDERVQDYIQGDIDGIYEEYIRLTDMYYKEPLGFPTEEAALKFKTIQPMLLPMFMRLSSEVIESNKNEKEKVHDAIKNAIRGANVRRRYGSTSNSSI